MQITFSEPVSCASIDGKYSAQLCPTIQFSETVSHAQMLDFVIRFAAFFYEREVGDVHEHTQFIEELEVFYYTLGNSRPLMYGRLFINPHQPDSTGLSDKGFTVFLFLDSITDAMGLAVNGADAVDDLRTPSALTVFLVKALVLRDTREPPPGRTGGG